MKRTTRSSGVYLILAPMTQDALEQEDMFKSKVQDYLALKHDYTPGEVFPWTTCELPLQLPGMAVREKGCLAISDEGLNRPLAEICLDLRKDLNDICDDYGYCMTMVALE